MDWNGSERHGTELKARGMEGNELERLRDGPSRFHQFSLDFLVGGGVGVAADSFRSN